MKPIASTPETRRRGKFNDAIEILANCTNGVAREKAARVVACGRLATLAALDAAAPGWWHAGEVDICDGCGEHVARFITMDPGLDGAGVVICRLCLVAALAALDGAP